MNTMTVQNNKPLYLLLIQSWEVLKERSGRLAAKVFLIGTDRPAKHCGNYSLISRQLEESHIPFNINNLTL